MFGQLFYISYEPLPQVCNEITHFARLLCFLLFLSEETAIRYEIFKANMARVKIYNEAEQGTAVYGATQFADMTGKLNFTLLV